VLIHDNIVSKHESIVPPSGATHHRFFAMGVVIGGLLKVRYLGCRNIDVNCIATGFTVNAPVYDAIEGYGCEFDGYVL